MGLHGSASGAEQLRAADDVVVLLDQHDRPCGTAPRLSVHTAHTPLHLAFSCYVRRADGRLLMTRRALTKRTWPGVWTNSCCGHPRPGEPIPDAISRRLVDELGAMASAITVALPYFRYRAEDASGIVENEFCPVYVATLIGDVHPDEDEVAEIAWVDPAEIALVAARTPWLLSPWCVSQLAQLHGAL